MAPTADNQAMKDSKTRRKVAGLTLRASAVGRKTARARYVEAGQPCPTCGRKSPGPRKRSVSGWDPARLFRLRQRAGLSVVALAAKIGVDRSTIATWERDTTPSLEMIARLERALGGKLKR